MKNTPTQLEPNAPVTRSHSMGFVILISCAAGLGGLLYGYDTAVISGAIGFLKDLYSLSPFMEGLVISSIMIEEWRASGYPDFKRQVRTEKNFNDSRFVICDISNCFGAFSRCVYLNHCKDYRGPWDWDGLITLCYVYYGSGAASHPGKPFFLISTLYDIGHIRNVLY